MIIRNCLELLAELSELEKLMDEQRKSLRTINEDLDSDELLVETLRRYLKNKNS
ncbi:hypothetical protein HBN50_04125 [Halobacteriovorax sp. GB3]|uniref:hypothetical protein n=1 Tax=Halobacteriovorax sp. GB3 TaxID=2719615 RepID=UPI00236097A6|nr:hypothetical protein [Halobacteriovorax sp. GB3]MDD0852268.1 hypothetical protein [Halobacteriovorax sp. GB3]